MSLNMNKEERKILSEMLSENNDDTVRRKLINKYNVYYRLWQDFVLLVALLAMIGLGLACFSWENEFSSRGADGTEATK